MNHEDCQAAETPGEKKKKEYKLTFLMKVVGHFKGSEQVTQNIMSL